MTAALNEAVLIDSRLVEDVVIMQLIHAEVRPAARRVVNHVDVDGHTVQVDHTEIQTLLDSLGVLVLQRSS